MELAPIVAGFEALFRRPDPSNQSLKFGEVQGYQCDRTDRVCGLENSYWIQAL
jgi:hypothetical protein